MEVSPSNDLTEYVKRLQGQADLTFLAIYASAIAVLIGLVMAASHSPAGTLVVWIGFPMLVIVASRHTWLKRLIETLSKSDTNINPDPLEMD